MNESQHDPFRVFALEEPIDADTTKMFLPLWLVNRSDEELSVEASAGAGSVVLDTVPARDSVLVRLETRATEISLSGRTIGGGMMGEATVPVTEDTVRIAFPR